jgi:CRISPR/Cas system-associated endonuclease/helicase Cas3
MLFTISDFVMIKNKAKTFVAICISVIIALSISLGYFIFDEIHAYNPKVFAQIISLLHFATKYLAVKVFIMTATLPSFLRNRHRFSEMQSLRVKATMKQLFDPNGPCMLKVLLSYHD